MLADSTLPRCAGEALGTCTAIYVFGTALANKILAGTKGNNMSHGFVALGGGLGFFLGLQFTNFLGTSLNPAMSFASAILGDLGWLDLLAVVGAEVAGAFAGAVLVWLHYLPHFRGVLPAVHQHDKKPETRRRDHSHVLFVEAGVGDSLKKRKRRSTTHLQAQKHQRRIYSFGKSRMGRKLVAKGTPPKFVRTGSKQVVDLRRRRQLLKGLGVPLLELKIPGANFDGVVLKIHFKSKYFLRRKWISIVSRLTVSTDDADRLIRTLSASSLDGKGADQLKFFVNKSPTSPGKMQLLEGQLLTEREDNTVPRNASNRVMRQRHPTSASLKKFGALFGARRNGESCRDPVAGPQTPPQAAGVKESENRADQVNKLLVFCTKPTVYNPLANLAAEAFASFFLVYGILVIDERGKMIAEEGEDVYFSTVQGLFIGTLIGALVLGAGGTGTAINPARDLGPRIAHFVLPIPGKGSSEWWYGWIPAIGPFIGAAVAAGLWNRFRLLGESLVL